MEDQIEWYYQRLDVVNSVKIQQKDKKSSHSGLVEFEMSEAAATVVTSGKHQIGDCDAQVEAAAPWQQPDYILNTLNDDCLRVILSKLDQIDLANAANVCIRFNGLAKSVFSTKFKQLDLTNRNYEYAEKLLQTFGSVAYCIDIKGMNALAMANRYCSSMLKELTLRECGYDDQLSNDLKFDLVFSKLETLSFIDCRRLSGLNNFLSACVDLKVLRIKRCFVYEFNMPVWPKLEEIRMRRVRGDEQFLNRIIATNSNVTKLSVIICEFSKIFRNVVQNLPNLVELEIKENRWYDTNLAADIRSLGYLTALKVFKFYFNGSLLSSSSSLISALTENPNISIEHLELGSARIDTIAVKAIAQMKQLKILELRDIHNLTEDHIIELTKALGPQLKKLECHSKIENLSTIGIRKMLSFATKLSLLTLKSTTITIDEYDYKALLSTLQKRLEKIPLLIKLTWGEKNQVQVDEAILAENRDIFYIEETDSNTDFYNLFGIDSI